jgi:hypothetical protein
VTAALLTAGGFGGTAWADDPTPAAGAGAAAPAPADVQPTSGTWIIGGTLQEGAQSVTPPVTQPVVQPVAKPATKPVAKPVAKPVTQPATRPVAKPVVRTRTTAPRTVTPAGDATVLPFTGPGHVELLLPVALLLLGTGLGLTVLGRPRFAV